MIRRASHSVLRAARTDEAQLLSELALYSKAHWGYSPEFIEACRAELTYTAQHLGAAQMRFVVLEDAGRVVGFYALNRVSAADIELDALFVAPHSINRGFGRRLLEDAQRVALDLGAEQLSIQADPNAERFYLAAGARRTGASESSSIPGRMLPTLVIDLIGVAAR